MESKSRLFLFACIPAGVLLLGVAGAAISVSRPHVQSTAHASGVDDPPRAKKLPAEKMQAPKFFDLCITNSVEAERKFQKSPIEIRGYASGIHPGVNGKHYVGMLVIFSLGGLPTRQVNAMSDRQRQSFQEGYPPNIHCYLSKASQSRVVSFKRDQVVSVTGYYSKIERDPSVWKEQVVTMTDCEVELVAPESPPKS